MNIPKSHPRYESLKTRNLVVNGIKNGITSMHGLIAHGRGEAFDYLLGEKTNRFAINSIEAAAAMLLIANNPVVSVNGNAAALVPKEIVMLSKLVSAPLEVNIFHESAKRGLKIKRHLMNNGATKVLLPSKKFKLLYLDSNRKFVSKSGIMKSDVVLVPLEDGDRTEALIKNNKKVITIDLNPLSRTAQNATITIVDNITRSVPLLINTIKKFKRHNKTKLETKLKRYSNEKNLNRALKYILQNFP